MIIILGESMKFDQFQLERNQSLFENEVDYNLSESGIHPLKISEILTLEEQNEILDIRDIGFKKQFEIFEIVKSKYDFNPIVINSDYILKNPKEIIRKLCERLNIKFSNKMLNWPKGPRNSDGIWSVIWYEQVNKSNTFTKYNDSNTVVPSKYQNIYKESLKIYNNMNKYSL